MEKHLRSCQKAPTHPPKQQLRQTMLDGPTSFKNGPSTPKKLMVEEVQVGSAPAEYAEHWKAPEIVNSPLKYTALTFRKIFNCHNKRNILQQLKDIIHSTDPVIEGQTRANAEAIKCYLSLNMNFCKFLSAGVKTDVPVTFRSEVLKSTDTHELNYQFYVGYKRFVQQIDEFQRNGSDWVVNHLEHFDLGFCNFYNKLINLIVQVPRGLLFGCVINTIGL